MSDELILIFAECVEAIEQGRLTVEECLLKYEKYRYELEELLLVATEMRTSPVAVPAVGFRESARTRLMARMLIGSPYSPYVNGTSKAGKTAPVLTVASLTFIQRLRAIPHLFARAWPFSLRSTWAVGMGFLAFCLLLFGGLVIGGGGLSSADTAGNRGNNLIPAQTETATLEVLEGAVEVLNTAGKWEPVNKFATVTAGQRIRTGDFSSAKLTFSDGSSTTVGANSDFTVNGNSSLIPLLGPSLTPTDTPTSLPPTDTPTPIPPTDTSTPIPPTDTPSPITPTDTPTPIPVTDTPTPVDPTDTPTPEPPTPTATDSVTPTPGQEFVTICHKPGTPAEQTKTIPVPALNGHLGHGDYIGTCQATPTPPVPTPTPADPTPTPVDPSPTPVDPSPTPVDPTPTPDGNGLVTICHKPGTPAQQTLNIPESALPGHLGHGDTLGACE